jgi:sterol 3beta-glucosyltransferase
VRIFLATLGSRGDFEPFLNFAIEAQRNGHQVVIAATSEFVDQVLAAGITCVPLSGSFQDLIQDTGVSVFQAMKDFNTKIKPVMTSALHTVAEAILEYTPDAVVYHPKVLSAPIAAQKIGAISVVVELAPMVTPTREFGAAGLGNGNLGLFNTFSYTVVAQSSSLFAKELNALAQSLDVPVRKADYSVCLVSPSLLKRPKDWSDTTQLVGPWIRSDDTLTENLQVLAFIESAPTVYFGFGSMASGDAKRRTEIVGSAAKAVGMQALIVTGWGGLDASANGPGVMTVASVRHDEVFSKVAVAVHHGGAGTVQSALRCGVPSVIVPFIADQPWWGALLSRQELGPSPIPQSKLSITSLATAIRTALNYTAAVRTVANGMKHEDGVSATLALLERWVTPQN